MFPNCSCALLLWCALVLAWYPATGSAAGGPEDVQLTASNSDEGLAFTAHNAHAYDITITLTLTRCENLHTDDPLTFTVPAGQTLRAVALARDSAADTWQCRYDWHWNIGSTAARHDDAARYVLPYLPGHAYPIIQGYQGRFSHTGQDEYALDWAMPAGTPVCAARSGLVVAVKENSAIGGPDRSYSDQGNYVYLRHDDGTIGMYLHFAHHGVAVQPGQHIAAGEIIGYAGNTGFSTVAHLHFCVISGKDGFERVSLPVLFQLPDGSVRALHEGDCFTAPAVADPGAVFYPEPAAVPPPPAS